MVDSLPPSGTDPDNQTIITNSNGKLSVPLEGTFLDVGSSGKVKFFETTYYLANFDQDFGDWTGIDRFDVDGIATVNVDAYYEEPKASFTADLTDIDELNFRIDPGPLYLEIYVDGNYEGFIEDNEDRFVKYGIRGFDYGANTTVRIEAIEGFGPGTFKIDYVQGINKPESGIFELVDTGGL